MFLYGRNFDLSRGRGKGIVGPLQEVPESLVGEWWSSRSGVVCGCEWLFQLYTVGGKSISGSFYLLW